MKTRDDMIEVAARAFYLDTVKSTPWTIGDWGSMAHWHKLIYMYKAACVIDALIAAGVIPEPEATVTTSALPFDAAPCESPSGYPVPYVAVGFGEPMSQALRDLYVSMAKNWE